ncbi:MAG: amino acid permease [Deltaproteobacteria bacterium]|nr:amino acid permease [Deltaproteobacteria bacterium]
MEDVQTSGRSEELKRGLTNRHIQMMALGSAIGVGLFLGSYFSIKTAGPSLILAYALGGFIVFILMRQLGEMAAQEPVSGSFSYFSYKYISDYAGFLSGWTFWLLEALIAIIELTAAAAFMTYWFPNVPTWVWTVVFFVMINAINLMAVNSFGEFEFWFCLIKIVAIMLMIVFGVYILMAGIVPGASLTNLWSPAPPDGAAEFAGKSGFFPNGLGGMFMAMPAVVIAFCGLETIGVAAAETGNPKVVIPKAVNQVIWRILLFYLGTFIVLLSIKHWTTLGSGVSPFVLIFDSIGFKAVAGTLNFVVLTAVLSVFNTCIYLASRLLYSLGLQGNAPQFFTVADKRGVPVRGLSLCAGLTLLVVPLNLIFPTWQKAFGIAINFAATFVLINWFLICTSHYFFRRSMIKQGIKPHFPAFWHPFSNYFIWIAMPLILVAMHRLGETASVVAAPVWILVSYVFFILMKKYNKKRGITPALQR